MIDAGGSVRRVKPRVQVTAATVCFYSLNKINSAASTTSINLPQASLSAFFSHISTEDTDKIMFLTKDETGEGLMVA